jgi:uncharacterized protein YjeT (DUF2065 family)
VWGDLLAALALVMIIEGIIPFLSPRGFKESMLKILQMDDRALRIMGLLSMVAGVILLYWVR